MQVLFRRCGPSNLSAMYLLVTIEVDESKVAVAILPTLVSGFSVVDVKLFLAEERGPAPQAPSLLTAGELLEIGGEKPDFCLLPPLPVCLLYTSDAADE